MAEPANLGPDNELAREKAALLKAEDDIAAGEERIVQQLTIIERLHRAGLSVVEAEKLLENLQKAERLWRDHRDLIIQRIAYLEGRSGKLAGAGGSLDPSR